MFEEHAVKILWFSIIVIPLIHLLGTKLRTLGKWVWFGKVILIFLLLITGEIVLVDGLAETAYISYVKMGFDILWWLVPTYLIILAIEVFIWTPFEKYNEHLIPNIYRIFTMVILYLLAGLGIVIFINESPIIGSIMAVLLVIIIGLSVQKMLALSLLNTLTVDRIGDWVKIGEFEEGKVIESNWKLTRLQTRDNCIIEIPNHLVLQSPVKNFSYPDQYFSPDNIFWLTTTNKYLDSPDNIFWLTTTIKVSDVHQPEKVKKILLDAVLSIDNILQEPSPVVVVSDMSNGTLEYTVSYCGNNYADKTLMTDELLKGISHHLKQADIVYY